MTNPYNGIVPGGLKKRRRYKTEAIVAKVFIVFGLLLFAFSLLGVVGTEDYGWQAALFMVGSILVVLAAIGLNVIIDYFEVQLGQQYGE